MEENRHRVSRYYEDGSQQPGPGQFQEGQAPAPTRRKKKYNTRAVDDEVGEAIECSGKYCRSCTAGLIADCVALCCCPCGLFNLLALAFVKVPYMVGRKCLGRVKKKRKSSSLSKKTTCKIKSCSIEEGGHDHSSIISTAVADDHDDDRDGNLKKRRAEDGILEITRNGFGGDEDDEMKDGDGGGGGGFSARFDAVEKVWLELYKDGHLGFGRVSFTGIQ